MQGEIDKLKSKMKQYLELLKDNNQEITHPDGHYKSDNKDLRRLEKYFLKHVPKHELQIMARLRTDYQHDKARYYAHLLNWGKDTDSIETTLLDCLQTNNHILHNDAARALGPLLDVGKARGDIDIFLDLTTHESNYCKNKGLGCIWFMSWRDEDIRKITNHKTKFQDFTEADAKIVRNPAQMVLEKLRTLKN